MDELTKLRADLARAQQEIANLKQGPAPAVLGPASAPVPPSPAPVTPNAGAERTAAANQANELARLKAAADGGDILAQRRLHAVTARETYRQLVENVKANPTDQRARIAASQFAVHHQKELQATHVPYVPTRGRGGPPSPPSAA